MLLVTTEYPPYGSGIANAVHSIKKNLIESSVNVDVLSPTGGDFTVSRISPRLNGLLGLVFFWEQVPRYIKKSEKTRNWMCQSIQFFFL